MKLAKLRRKLIAKAKRERRRGAMSTHEYIAALEVAHNEEALVVLNERIEAEVYSQRFAGGVGSFFANLWDWFTANWPTILKIILTIAPMVLAEPKDENS